MTREGVPTAAIPVATYRLQFNRLFTFADARRVVPYLHELGISHVYASSYVTAKEGSLHGYDVVDPNSLNPEIGTEQEYLALVDELQKFGMGQILDFVPNHMCIESSRNAWWMDVLENGRCSPHAPFFDINWDPVKQELTNKVLLPFLGDQYGKVLERGELRLAVEGGAFFISYYDSQFPVEPTSFVQILGHRLESLDPLLPGDDPARLELLSIMTALQHLPPTTESDPQRIAERYREKEIVKKRLAQLCQDSTAIQDFVNENVGIFNGTKGEPRSFDLLDRLLCSQVFRLSFWRVATEEINYRRFFDINGLSAIRMEDPVVFQDTHAFLFRLIREGKISGVRIDHVDGLYDPHAYLRRLQRSCHIQICLGASPGCNDPGEDELAARFGSTYDDFGAQDSRCRPLYLLCEKILLKGERLPEEWPVDGTTGYDFLNSVNGIFVEADNARIFESIYSRFIKSTMNFAEVVYEKKLLVMQVALAGETNTLGHYLNTISEQDRLTRDFTLNSLIRAIRDVIAFFPVYRTYVNPDGVREKDSQYIDAAVAKAKRKNPAMSPSIFDFLRSVLLLRFPPYLGEQAREEWLRFVMRFQQITGPVMAKGLEDTAFYVYNRLISLNEVGGMPERFGTPLDAFHGHNKERAKSFPHSLLATATHDSKRGEDLRTRIDALSELPEEWRTCLNKWSRLNKGKKIKLEGQAAPGRNEEYFIYQTLVGAWPVAPMNREGDGLFRSRLREYLVKSLREAKINSSWISPDTAYEDAVGTFIDAILAEQPGNLFLREFKPFQQKVARAALFSSLSQMLLKMTCPGVPDFYQGTELWEMSLVDPDNRRPVDYQIRREALAALKRREQEIGPEALVGQLLNEWHSGHIKLYLIYRTLAWRRHNRELFDHGRYQSLEVSGSKGKHVCAFARELDGNAIVAVAPRLIATLLPREDMLPLGQEVWGDTALELPWLPGTRLTNVLTGEAVTVIDCGGNGGLPLAQICRSAPVALLVEAAG